MNEKRGKSKKLYVVILIILIIALFKIVPLVKEYNRTVSADGNPVTVVINDGESARDVAKLLADKGLIKSEWTFVIKYKLNRDKYKEIYSGEFNLNDGMCLADILSAVTTSPNNGNTYTLIIPEGYSVEMIAAKCEKLGVCSADEFKKAVEANDYNYEFIKSIPDANYKYKLEGFLFPNTYEFFTSATPHDIVDKMLATFESEYKKHFSDFDNVFKNVTVASIVEREAVLDSERPKIAGVIYNRLKDSMLLQVDATVVYAKSNGRYDMTSVSYDDLKVDSPYNTYKNQGLTPGPICNPGINSIIAAANPESHNYLFYHTDENKKDGSHIFTENFDDHVATMD